jgi:uncharacterized protein GlcG (DUF336 family)
MKKIVRPGPAAARLHGCYKGYFSCGIKVRRIMPGRTSILLEEAQRVIQAAMDKAEEIGQPMNVAVMDNGRDLKAFARMEDAWLGSVDIAINKAFTSTSFLMPTQDLAEMTQPGQPLYGLETTNNGRVVNFAGGIPLMRDGEVAGAIGVSGGTVDQDQEVAEAGVAAFS